MSEFCPRCEARVLASGICENGHGAIEAETHEPTPCRKCGSMLCVCFSSTYANQIAAGLSNHLRTAAREYLERLVRELG